MVAFKRILIFVLVSIYLVSCASVSGGPAGPSEASPSTASTQPVTSAQSTSPSPALTASLVSTQSSNPVTDTETPETTGTATTRSAEITLAACPLAQVTQPPWPVATLPPNGLDPETNLHVTGRAQQIDLATYRLKISGLVDHPLSLTYDELRCLPKVTDNPLLNCPGVFKDEAIWSGVPVKYILDLAGVQQGATDLVLVSADGYQVKLPLATASLEKNFLAYEVNGETLPVLHGFPLRAVFPGMWGSYWLKWLVEIQIE